jgi:tetratricopeptide (TPR) repeat protein
LDQMSLLRLHCKLFDLNSAKAVADQIMQNLLDQKAEMPHWLAFASPALRLYAELGEGETIAQLRSRFLNTDTQDKAAQASLWAIRGRIAIDTRDLEVASRAFALSLEYSRNDLDRLKANFGLCMLSMINGDFESAQDRMNPFLPDVEENELRIVLLGALAQCARGLNNQTEAFSLLGKAKTLAKFDRNIYLWILITTMEIESFLLLGDTAKAKDGLDRIDDLMPTDFTAVTHQRIHTLENQVHQALSAAGFELVSSEGREILKTPDKKIVDLTTQPILIQLMELLSGTPRVPISKEAICQSLWGSNYHPLEIDNKIYVSIRRLRLAIGDIAHKPKFILKRSDGYMLNPAYQFTIGYGFSDLVLSFA